MRLAGAPVITSSQSDNISPSPQYNKLSRLGEMSGLQAVVVIEAGDRPLPFPYSPENMGDIVKQGAQMSLIAEYGDTAFDDLKKRIDFSGALQVPTGIVAHRDDIQVVSWPINGR